MSWNGEDLFKAVLLGGGSGGSSGGGIPQADIDAAFAALAEKGVTVPDGATSADLDDLIASIVTGGGDGMWIQTGTITPTSNATLATNAKVIGVKLDESKGRPQILYMCKVESETDESHADGDFFSGIAAPGILPGSYLNCRYSSKYFLPRVGSERTTVYKNTQFGVYFVEDFSLIPTGIQIWAGATYRWIAIGGISA